LDKPARDATPFSIELPHEVEGGIPQDEEWCQVRVGDEEKRIRFHDYHEIYAIPGLYEELFYNRLQCCSPRVVSDLLKRQVEQVEPGPSYALRVLDLGAGNGMMGAELQRWGDHYIVGIDIIPEAAEATERDRPGVCARYLVDDLTRPSPATRATLQEAQFNCVTAVGALGFGDIPPLAFCEALRAVSTPGWVAFNIKEDFLNDRDQGGFSGLIVKLIDEAILSLRVQQRYQHRLSIAGAPLYYMAVIARKEKDLPSSWLERLRAGEAA